MGKTTLVLGVGVATAVAVAAVIHRRRNRQARFTVDNIPTFDLTDFLSSGQPNAAQAKEMAEYLRETGSESADPDPWDPDPWYRMLTMILISTLVVIFGQSSSSEIHGSPPTMRPPLQI